MPTRKKQIEITQEEYDEAKRIASIVYQNYKRIFSIINVELEDFQSDILLKLVTAKDRGTFHSGRNKAALSTWLYQVCKFHSMNLKAQFFSNKRQHKRANLTEENYESMVEGNAGAIGYPFNALDADHTMMEDQIIAQDQLERYMEHVEENFSEGHVEAVKLLMDGYTYDEIADAMCIPSGTAKTRIARAKGSKRERFDRDDD